MHPTLSIEISIKAPNKKVVKPPVVEVQVRDLEVLRGLFESRVMTQEQACLLYFEGKSEATKKRLQKYKALRWIAERKRLAYHPAILYITKRGFDVLAAHGKLSDYPRMAWHQLEKRAQVSELTIRHEIDVMNVKAALSVALKATGRYTVADFLTWPMLYQFKASKPKRAGQYTAGTMVVKPDGFLRVHEPVLRQSELLAGASGEYDEHLFFLEIDRSTEAQSTLELKAFGYRDYFQTGGLAQRYGYPAADYKNFAFRVLMVFRNAERRNNCAETLLRMSPPVLSQVWLTTQDELITDPLGAIWLRPQDYRDAVAGTAFDITRRFDSVYRRRPEREALVEARAGKTRLLKV
jgi:hypothetical protein